ncbi:Histidine kinase 3 [Platanthera guangdongensis]|uniref:Histidine kinase 3 n=1 Tax=Platanthera guangdongensis TaxID=2320717 RepID=A0ABR2MFT1_9ASPA
MQIQNMEQKINELINYRDEHWHIPILAMTADVFQANHDEYVRCGMDGYVSKPFKIEQLYSSVAQFFESYSAAKAS